MVNKNMKKISLSPYTMHPVPFKKTKNINQ